MTLAARYLGDPLRFYILARYNGIATPADLRVGQVLKIPGVPRRALAPRISRPAPAAAAEKRAASPPTAASVSPPSQPERATSLRALALEDMNRGHINHAVSLLEKAAQLDPGSPLIIHDLARARRIQATVDRK